MASRGLSRRLVFLVLIGLGCFLGRIGASAGDVDPLYRNCVDQCEETGQLGSLTFRHCNFSSDGLPLDGPWYTQEPLYLRWKQVNCKSDCRYHCMMQREGERTALGLEPVKYHGKWPFIRLSVFQEPVSAALSALNLIMHFNGWLSFFLHIYYKLPMTQSKRSYYEYTGLWHVYGLLAMNAWFWSAIFHSRDIDITEKLDYSAAVALLGFSLVLSVLRTFSVRDEASRVMVAAPLLAFVVTHILYLNFYDFDYGLNMRVCVGMGLAQMAVWAVWAGMTQHPSRFKVWTVVIGGALAMLLEIYDFPVVGARGCSRCVARQHRPLTYLWWTFAREDAEYRISTILKKAK